MAEPDLASTRPARRGAGARVLLGAVLLGAVLLGSALLAGCSSSGAAGTPTTGAPTTGAPTTATPTTTAEPTTAPPTTAAPQSPVGFATPRQAAQHLVDAWRSQDRAGALQGADPGAVDQMFTAPAPHGSIYECDKGDSSPSYCTVQVYGAKLLYVQLEMVKRPVGWVVDYANVQPLH